MEEAEQLSLESRWAEAIKVLEGALGRLEPGAGYQPLRRRVEDALESYKKEGARQREAPQERDRRIHRRARRGPPRGGRETPKRAESLV